MFVSYATRLQQVNSVRAKLGITIKNCIPIRRAVREGFSQLLHYPGFGRMFGNIEMEDLASAMIDDKEAVQDPEYNGRNGEEIHRGNDVTMIAQKSGPEFAFLVARG
jgi:hypothetical protein